MHDYEFELARRVINRQRGIDEELTPEQKGAQQTIVEYIEVFSDEYMGMPYAMYIEHEAWEQLCNPRWRDESHDFPKRSDVEKDGIRDQVLILGGWHYRYEFVPMSEWLVLHKEWLEEQKREDERTFQFYAGGS